MCLNTARVRHETRNFSLKRTFLRSTYAGRKANCRIKHEDWPARCIADVSRVAPYRLGHSQETMKDSIHVSKENYLKAILEAEAEGRQVIPAMLAHWLEVSAPAVTMALKRLKRDGCVKVGDDGIVRLTAAGREMAYRTALRHHLIERMLSEVFGMEWHEIHEEAERLEHAVSPAFEAKLKEKLGEGGACPHGNAVLPVNPAERKRRGEMQLSQAAAGKRYTVISLHERDPKLLEFLHAAGIGPGKSVRVMSQNYDQTVLIDLPTGNVILGRPAAEAVWLRLER